MSDLIQSYNTYQGYPDIPFNCISYLLDNNEDVWKLLKYNDPRAYAKPNLTSTEKGNLIYNGDFVNINDFRVFMDTGQDDAVLSETTILKISTVELIPTNYVYGMVTIAMEVFTHYKCSQLANYRTRLDSIIQSLIQTFNGSDIKNVGRLYFDQRASARTRAYAIGSIPYKGKCIIFSNNILG